jgi:L-seryl-tRNA(Ser) seleniumtransferase
LTGIRPSSGMGLVEELGVRPLINAAGTLTVLGGSVLSPEVLEAVREASQVYVDMTELHAKAGRYVASLLGVEDAYITCGAGAGLALAVAACMVRDRPEARWSLPRAMGLRSTVVVQSRQRNFYDYIIEKVGARIREVGVEGGTDEREFAVALDGSVCATVYFAFDPMEGVLPLARVVEIAHSRGVPVIVDAAAELPPRSNLRYFYDAGADAVLFSAGKDLGAPNDTGIIVGRRWIVELCRVLGPHSYEQVEGSTRINIGRTMKTSKEDIFAVVAALKSYLGSSEEERLKAWKLKAEYIASALRARGVEGVEIVYPEGIRHPRPPCIPRVEIRLGTEHEAERLLEGLRAGDPPIYAYRVESRVYINPQCLRGGEERVVAERLLRELGKG